MSDRGRMTVSTANGQTTISGVKELATLLSELPKKVAKQGLRRAVTLGASPFVKTMKASVPRESGLLKKAITKKVKTYPSGLVVAVVGAASNKGGYYKGHRRVPAWYIHIVEGGAKAHTETSKKLGRTWQHPGFAGRPFVARSFSTRKAEAGNIVQLTLADFIDAESRKLAKP